MENLQMIQKEKKWKMLKLLSMIILTICLSIINMNGQTDYYKTQKLNSGYNYFIVAKHSNLVLDVADNNDGTPIVQYGKHGGQNQQFKIVEIGNGYYIIKSVSSGKFLEILNSSKTDGAKLVQHERRKGESQFFRLIDAGNGYCKIQVSQSGKFLDVAGSSTENGGSIVQYLMTGNDNQLFKFSKAKATDAKDYQLSTYIECIEEDDGGGSSEEIFGNIYAKTQMGQFGVWERAEDAYVNIKEGSHYYVPGVTLLKRLKLDSKIELGGHLFEEDTGGDDDLGFHKKEITVKDLLAGEKRVRYSYEDTKIDVVFFLQPIKTSTKEFSDFYFTLNSIKCIVPSKGTDRATEAATGIGIAIGSIVGGFAVSFASPNIGSAIIVTGLKTAIFSSPDVVKLFNKVYKGSDDLYIKVDDAKVWPSDEYVEMKSQQSKNIDKTFGKSEMKVELMEYDSGSDDDNMGGFSYDIRKEIDSMTYEEKKQLAQTRTITKKVLIKQYDEESTYELTFTIDVN